MELAIDENQIAKQVAEQMAKQITPLIEELVKRYERPDELLDAKQICRQVLHCSTTTLTEFFLYQPGFPSIYKGNRRVFSRKAVEKWIADHQDYS